MFSKVLVVDPEKCNGCRICEVICSFLKEKECNPVKSRIRVIKIESLGIDIPMVCHHCEKPLCRDVCPVDAITRDVDTGAILLNEEVCIVCRACIQACPHGALSINGEKGTIFVCDLCKGDPQCVKNCEPKALQYIEASSINLKKRRMAAEKLSELMKTVLKVT